MIQIFTILPNRSGQRVIISDELCMLTYKGLYYIVAGIAVFNFVS